ncbi:MAG: hypothetical protein ACOY90_18350 [Candidatus Zhuqueibacterota bacterium]
MFRKTSSNFNIVSSKQSVLALLSLLATGILLLLSCSDRERLNPIDPQNPETGGRPQGFRGYSEYNQATLLWPPIGLENFSGHHIYRKTVGDTAFRLIHFTPPDSNLYRDRNLVYDQSYQYCMTVKAGDFESLPGDTIRMTPGPTFIWATDVFLRYVLKITHDGSTVIDRIPVDGYPWDIELISSTGELWYTDVMLNRVLAIDRMGGQRIVDELESGEPVALSFDARENRVWLADETLGKILVYDTQGAKTAEYDGFTKPYYLDADGGSGACWIADIGSDQVVKMNRDGGIAVVIDSLYRPKCLAVNQTHGDCWVADSCRVLRFSSDGELELVIDLELIHPLNVAVDSESGNCWVLDFSYDSYRSKLFCFSETGEKLVEIDGFTQPENLIVNPYDHSCIVADSGSGTVFKIDQQGQIIGESQNHVYPYGLAIEYMR